MVIVYHRLIALEGRWLIANKLELRRTAVSVAPFAMIRVPAQVAELRDHCMTPDVLGTCPNAGFQQKSDKAACRRVVVDTIGGDAGALRTIHNHSLESKYDFLS
jgi:hypothetical protein